MKKLRAALEIVEKFENDRLVELVFSDYVSIKYTDLEMVDESVYGSNNFCMAKKVNKNGVCCNVFAEFDINEIIKVIDVKNNVILYDRK